MSVMSLVHTYDGRHRPRLVAVPRRSVLETARIMWASFVDWAKIPFRNWEGGYDGDPA